MARCAHLFVSLVLAGAASAQKLQPPAEARTKVDQIFARFQSRTGPGCAVGVGIQGETVLSAAYGMADLEHEVPITTDTIFEPGSVSKQFTAAAVLLLAQQGKLSLDEPVRKYIPELPNYETPITIRHLLNHTSGLRDWGNLMGIAGWPRSTRTYTHQHVLDIVSRQRALNYSPGGAYSYSNTGYNLSAILVARVAGKPLPEFTREMIFVPLGMNSTSWRDDFRRIVPKRAIAYSQSGAAYRQDMPFENVFGNGGLLTTVGDLLRWNRNFTSMQVGGRTMVDAAQQRGKLNDGHDIAYAAGLMMLNWKGRREVSHSGSTAGYSAWLGRYPERDLSVAVLCNLAGTNATQLGHQVADIYFGGAAGPAEQPSMTLDSAALAARAGMYCSMRDHHVVTVRYEEGQLRLDRRVMRPISANVCILGEDSSRVEFQADRSGKVTRLTMSSELDPVHHFEKVEPAHPSTEELRAFTGEYSSDEVETQFKVRLDGGRLVIDRRPASAFPLTPTYRDSFNSAMGSVRFLRDSAGRVTELSVGESRVWDLRFQRVR